jgi:hypothetical protein
MPLEIYHIPPTRFQLLIDLGREGLFNFILAFAIFRDLPHAFGMVLAAALVLAITLAQMCGILPKFLEQCVESFLSKPV